MDDTFRRNLDVSFLFPWNNQFGSKKDLVDTADFWAVHLLAAYQAGVAVDKDPHMVGNVELEYVLGQASDTYNTGAIYMETVRELDAAAFGGKYRFWEIQSVVHEIGHQGGGLHSDGGIMIEGALINQEKFSPVTLNRFRSRAKF